MLDLLLFSSNYIKSKSKMSKEFNELFDIKEEQEKDDNLPIPKQNVLIHTIVRVLIVTVIGVCAILLVAALDANIELAILGAAIILGWFGFMIFEAIKLTKRNCRELANSNIVLMIIAILVIVGITVNVL
mgnify:CR=1 FL=1